MRTVREVFETNTFGVMNMCHAVIPHFRAKCAGTIVNVTSSTTLAPFPLVASWARPVKRRSGWFSLRNLRA